MIDQPQPDAFPCSNYACTCYVDLQSEYCCQECEMRTGEGGMASGFAVGLKPCTCEHRTCAEPVTEHISTRAAKLLS